MNILITGGAGFIGHHTANTFVDAGHFVRILDNLLPQVHKNSQESIQRLHSSIEFSQGDIRSHSDVTKALEDIEAVYHFAAETGVEQSMYEIERYVDVNIRGTGVLCDCIAEQTRKISKLVLASSRAVYGEGSYSCKNCGEIFPVPGRSAKTLKAGKWDFDCQKCGKEMVPQKTTENSPLSPISIYGLTKRVQEDLFENLYRTYGIPTVIFRYFNVMGAGQSLANPYTGIASIFCGRFLANREVEIYEDGAMLRDFVDVRDVVRANSSVLNSHKSQFLNLNIGSGESLSVLELAKKIKYITNSHSPVEISGKFRIGDIRHCFADISQANDLLEFAPKYSSTATLKALVSWARVNSKDLENN